MITASYPVYNQQKLLGVASQDQFATKLLLKLNFYADTFSFMVNKDGKAIVNTDNDYLAEINDVSRQHYQAVLHYRIEQTLSTLNQPNAQNSRYPFLNHITEQVIKNDTTSFKHQINDENYQIFALKTNITDWYIISVVPEKAIYHSLMRSLSMMSFVVVVVILIIYLFAAQFLFKHIINPIEELSHAAMQVRDGHLNVEINVKQRNEVGQLAAIFKQMLQNLRYSLIELEQKNQMLTLVNQEKNEFLGIAAHDLKNPLQGVQGSAELITMTLEAEEFDSREKIIEFADMIRTSSEHMFNLITNLLDVNAIESGEIRVDLQYAKSSG